MPYSDPDMYRAMQRAYYHRNRDVLNQRSKDWYARNKARAVATTWRNRIRRDFGITEQEYNAMLVAQQGVCAICRQPPKRIRLDVDHCHATKKVRGLLCNKCNRGLGWFCDSDVLMVRAANYLKGE